MTSPASTSSAAAAAQGESVRVPPLYFVEKVPNLLIYNVHVPLGGVADISGTVLQAKRSVRRGESALDVRVPALSAIPSGQKGIRVLAPRILEGGGRVLEPMIDIPLDADVDLDRSTLRLSGSAASSENATKGDA